MAFQAIMNKRRLNRLDVAVRLQSNAIIEYFSDTNDPCLTPRRYNIGPPPKGISAEEFMGRVGIRATALIQDRWAPEDQYVYDHEASQQLRQSTEEFVALHPDSPLPRRPQDIHIVFNRLLAETEAEGSQI